jgi:hypothetical protein
MLQESLLSMQLALKLTRPWQEPLKHCLQLALSSLVLVQVRYNIALAQL